VNKEDLGHMAKTMTHRARRELVKQYVRGQKLTKQVVTKTYDQGAARLAELRSHFNRGVRKEGRDNDRKT
jgi:hypothetical protein